MLPQNFWMKRKDSTPSQKRRERRTNLWLLPLLNAVMDVLLMVVVVESPDMTERALLKSNANEQLLLVVVVVANLKDPEIMLDLEEGFPTESNNNPQEQRREVTINLRPRQGDLTQQQPYLLLLQLLQQRPHSNRQLHLLRQNPLWHKLQHLRLRLPHALRHQGESHGQILPEDSPYLHLLHLLLL